METAVAGITLQKLTEIVEPDNYVFEEGSESFNLIQQLALAVSCNRPVLLRGPVGSGKSSILEALAKKTGRSSISFKKVQLGEELDSRILLGGYQVSDIPGDFVWRPGILTQAVIEGKWILLEDIDAATSDVVTILNNLAKTRRLSVPGLSDNVEMHVSCRIFVTQRCNDKETLKILKDWFVLYCPGLTPAELAMIICRRWPKLTMIAEKMSSLLNLEFWKDIEIKNARRPSSHDLFKLAARADRYYQHGCPDIALRLFHDAVDIMCGSFPKDIKIVAAEKIGLTLGIVKHKANFICENYKPNVMFLDGKLYIGRVTLPVVDNSTATLSRNQKSVYSLTRPSCCLMEQIASCLYNSEPILLVGETGCGKTCSLQYLAAALNKSLVVINMSQQSEAADFLGGYKPVTISWLIKPICDEFEILFRDIFDVEKNADCLGKLATLIKTERWEVLLQFMIHVQKKAFKQLNLKISENDECSPAKRPKSSINAHNKWFTKLQNWENFADKLNKISAQLKASKKSLLFSFIEGSLVAAIKRGDWILLDEINLASSETLDCLHGILEGTINTSIFTGNPLSEFVRNQDFRIFAAMNPATDVGKHQLPQGLRNRFTEFYIDELDNKNDILPIVETYLRELNPNNERLLKVTDFYLKVKLDSKNLLLDGNSRKPHYSLRSLCRALMIAAKNPCGNFPRSLYESLCLSFLTQLDEKSYNKIHYSIVNTIVDNGEIKHVLNKPIPKPSEQGEKFVSIEGYWVSTGSRPIELPKNYILTNTVKRHLRDLLRVVSLGRGIPVLLEGDTSVGKTSLITYLAKCTGNICARLNNHEHTDIQEYIGTYVADSKGKLVFKEGILCEAMRKGYWLILDELNLAPSEVLEALNRVLDDNRELYVSETQTVIRAHEKFQLFATQNPPGQYGGRKELSRAFRNRFVELQVGQIPSDELAEILERRCQVPNTYCQKMVAVMNELQLRRRSSEIFVGKSGFITLRDLFRWGERYQLARNKSSFYDWEHHLADEGYILLTGRVRVLEERKIIQEVILKHFKRNIDPSNLFSLHENTSAVTKAILEKILSYSSSDENFKHIVWTYSMRRLAVLVCKALEFSEPILIVGETGCGKTTVVQVLATMHNRNLYSVNCHLHTETADFLGGLRPVRDHLRDEGKLFEWVDGPLIRAMQSGSWFLVDEISLADDSVLERLNSLLEPERTITLVEKGGNIHEEHVILADPSFSFIGTMNPGGDYGKKELSPALRNRLTEIWAGDTTDIFDDFKLIAIHNLKTFETVGKETVADAMIQFMRWFQRIEKNHKAALSTRDLLTWIDFINSTVETNSFTNLNVIEGLYHGCCLTFLDAIESMHLKNLAISKIKEIIMNYPNPLLFDDFMKFSLNYRKDYIGIHPFYTELGPEKLQDRLFVFEAPTTQENAWKLLRGLQTGKAILLEGSPGVGKTSLVEAFAKASGHKLVRINLSEQTDVSDLFGADLPSEGKGAGYFEWRDGPFLAALKSQSWILLDELNLASQSVLEGLNAVLDHRGELFVPELNRMFCVPTGTRLFACQNPLKQGGNRHGLPKSFLNRFTRLHVETLTTEAYQIILERTFAVDASIVSKMIEFSDKLQAAIAKGQLGLVGGPWEFNFRDLSRWCSVVEKLDQHTHEFYSRLFEYMQLLYQERFRAENDRQMVLDIYSSVFPACEPCEPPTIFLKAKSLHIADVCLPRTDDEFHGSLEQIILLAKGGKHEKEIIELCGEFEIITPRLMQHQNSLLLHLARCVENNWLPILVGGNGTGKTSVVHLLAALSGNNLRVMSVNTAMDTTEILGGFEQETASRHIEAVHLRLQTLTLTAIKHYLIKKEQEKALILVRALKQFSLPFFNYGNSCQNFQKRFNDMNSLLNVPELIYDAKSKLKYEQIKDLYLNVYNHFSLSSPSATGRFEWVDSVLVKSLQDGSWLLLEDVNLCSNAVLDRLNAVLEPNGVLAIGERGALKDGSVFTVIPHPNFRLFFTMNHSNGPISRAMKNRGVEIFLPDFNDRLANEIDLLALTKDFGLKCRDLQDSVLKFHVEKMKKIRCEINLYHLSAFSFWTASYLKHLFSEKVALKKAAAVVYKTQDIELIKKGIKRDLNLEIARPKLSEVLIFPHESRMKQACTYLISIVDSYPKLSDNDKVNLLHSLLPYFLLQTYLISTPCILNDQINFLTDILSSSYPHLLDLSNKLGNICKKVKNDPDYFESAWDMRWYQKYSSNHPRNDCIIALLVFELSLWLADQQPGGNSSGITVAQCCEMINSGQLNDFANVEILKEFSSILNAFDDLIRQYLSSERTCWHLDNLQWFLSAHKWRSHLNHISKLPLLIGKHKLTVQWDVLTNLKMHLLWFKKRLVDLIPLSCHPDHVALKQYQVTLNSFSDLNISVKVKLANILRGHMGSPKCTKKDFSLKISLPESQKFALLKYFYVIFATKLHGNIVKSLQLSPSLIVWDKILLAFGMQNRPFETNDTSHLLLKAFLLRITDIGYNFSAKAVDTCTTFVKQISPLYCATITETALGEIFPDPPSTLLTIHEDLERCQTFKRLILPNCLEISQVWVYEKNRLELEISSLIPLIKTIINQLPQNDKFLAEIKGMLNHLESFENCGSRWLILGLVITLILSQGIIDPVRKKLVKTGYALDEITEVEVELYCLEKSAEVTGVSRSHIYVESLKKRLKSLYEIAEKHESIREVKRDAKLFESLCSALNNFTQQLSQRLLKAVTMIEKEIDYTTRQYEVCLVLRDSIRESALSLEWQFLHHFPDILLPTLYAHQMMEHGLNLLLMTIKRNLEITSDSDISKIFQFPFCPLSSLKNELNFLKIFPEDYSKNALVILQTSFANLANQRMLTGVDISNQTMQLFSKFVEVWKKQEEEAERLQREKESLYLTKGTTKCAKEDEEAEINEAIARMFPSFFEDFDASLDKSIKVTQVQNLSRSTLDTIRSLHSGILNHSLDASWLNKSCPKTNIDFYEPLRKRYQMLNDLWPKLGSKCSSDLDICLLPGLLVLLPSKITADTCLEMDFYQDPNPTEVFKCVPVLTGLKERCNQLIKDWPEHPTLLQIHVLIERILGFPFSSPVMRFLTGLEILLQTCQHWESVAHEKVSISDHLISITNLIIDWRKLELQCWQSCLEISRRRFFDKLKILSCELINWSRIKQEASKWWFHLWSLFEEFQLDDKADENAVFQTLANFMENSSVVEFSERLEMLRTFHLQILLSGHRHVISPIRVWNLYRFYQQYDDLISSQLTSRTAAVAKQIKDFVKIAKWHDITYWSVKQSIEKSHRTLVKHIKEYEKILKQKVQLIKLDLPQNKSEENEGNASTTAMEMSAICSPSESLINLMENLNCPDLPKPLTLLNKCFKLSRETIQATQYSELIHNINGLVGDIIANIDHFSKIIPDESLPQEKRKAEAKSINQQKRRALADLFSTLGNLGISFRTGALSGSWGPLEISRGPPLSSKNSSETIFSGEDYFLKAAARFLQLQLNILQPSKDLGPHIVERLKGFAAHIMLLTQTMHANLVEAETPYWKLTELHRNLVNSPDDLLSSGELKQLDIVYEKLGAILFALKQFEVIFDKSWPEENLSKFTEETNFSGDERLPCIMTCSKADDEYVRVKATLQSLIKDIEILRNRLPTQDRLFSLRFDGGNMEIYHDKKMSNLFMERKDLRAFLKDMGKICHRLYNFRRIEFENHFVNPLASCLNFDVEIDAMNKLGVDLIEGKSVGNCEKSCGFFVDAEVENILKSTLHVVQDLYKKYRHFKKDAVIEQQFLDHHITKEIAENIEADLKLLKCDVMFEKVFKVFTKVFEAQKSLLKQNVNALRSITPFLKIYLDLSGFFIQQYRQAFRTVSKLASVLIGVFNLIAEKGFCTPPEIDGDGEENGDGGQSGGGLGLADGQGLKDVSDRIESEDQLEDARPADEQENKEDENVDCEEEEKGIETTEDFGGKAQDIKPKDENDENCDESDGDEADKEMGETEEGAEQLDKQLWESDGENEEEPESDNELKKDQGQGEKVGEENTYGAKEDESDGETDRQGQNQYKKDIEKMEDVDEEEQIDPYHGDLEPPPEPEPFDLPDDMNIDEKGDEEGKEEENPFDIDAMKEPKLPDEVEQNEEERAQNLDESENMEHEDEEKEEKEKDNSVQNVDENMAEIDNTEQDKSDENENEKDDVQIKDHFEPSKDKPAQMAQAAPETQNLGSKDQVVGKECQSEQSDDPLEKADKQLEESSGAGQAEEEHSSSGHNAVKSKQASVNPSLSENQRKTKKPGKSDDDRTVDNSRMQQAQRMQTVESSVAETDQGKEIDDNQDKDLRVDAVQHIKNVTENFMLTLDAATEEQMESRPVVNEDDNDKHCEEADDEVPMEVDEEEILPNPSEVEKLFSQPNDQNDKMDIQDGGGTGEIEEGKAVTEGEFVNTMTVKRGPESHLYMGTISSESVPLLTAEEVEQLRTRIQEQLGILQCNNYSSVECVEAWQLINAKVDVLARELAEQLRLVLEPTKATRFKGDFRSGRRINMRKVISYIASEFRKDRIWLRRTKPWKREHQIILAIDDSSSMADNKSKELAFESLALVAKSLNLLEAGDLSVVSFGESCHVLHPLGEPFTDETGARLLSELKFDQKKTRVADAIDLCVQMFTDVKLRDAAQLLLMVSDGRGVFSEGLENVKWAVRRADTQNIFIIFVIIDDPNSKDSIMDIRMPEFRDGKFVGIKPYMENFPFPYYLILRDISALPGTLCDALRQWFLVTSVQL